MNSSEPRRSNALRIGLGAGIGLFLFAMAVAAFYLTPLRLPLLNLVGREFPALRQSLQLQYAALQDREQRMAGTAADSVPDALKAAQEKAWREYAGQRSVLVEKVGEQSRVSAEGFVAWVTDLWMWLLLLGLARPAIGAWVGRLRSPVPVPAPATRADRALAELKAARRRISEITTTTLPPMVEVAPNPNLNPKPEPATHSVTLFQDDQSDDADKTLPPLGKVEYLEGVDTLFQTQLLEPLGEAPDPNSISGSNSNPNGSWKGGPEVWSPNALVMEDESADPTGEIPVAGFAESSESPENFAGENAVTENPDGENPYGKLPETTEFEQLERQREEVLRCARKGMTSSEIARRLRLGQDQVDLIIRMRRERGH